MQRFKLLSPIESFALAEVAERLTWCDNSARLFHLRDRVSREFVV